MSTLFLNHAGDGYTIPDNRWNTLQYCFQLWKLVAAFMDRRRHSLCSLVIGVFFCVCSPFHSMFVCVLYSTVLYTEVLPLFRPHEVEDCRSSFSNCCNSDLHALSSQGFRWLSVARRRHTTELRKQKTRNGNVVSSCVVQDASVYREVCSGR